MIHFEDRTTSLTSGHLFDIYMQLNIFHILNKTVIRASICTFSSHFYQSYVEIVQSCQQPRTPVVISIWSFIQMASFYTFSNLLPVSRKNFVTMVKPITIGCQLVHDVKVTINIVHQCGNRCESAIMLINND